jgi:glycosyltransferase involved in cell wall biosynthesis
LRILQVVKKRVLIIAYYWPPAGGGGVQRWLKFVKYLHNSDWQPVVFVPENADYPVYDETLLAEIPEGVEVIRCPIFEPYRALRKATGKGDAGISAGFIRSEKGPSFMERLMAWVRGNILIPDARMFWIRPASNFLLKYLKENPVDMIVSTGPPHSMNLIARRVHRKTDISWLADFRDPWVNMDNADKFQMSAWAKRRHMKLERSVLKEATVVDTVSWYLSSEYEKIRGGEVKVLTNGFDHVDFEGREVKPTDKFILGHYGTFGDDRNAPALWRALSRLVDESEEFKNRMVIRLVGPTDGSVLEDVKRNGLSEHLEYIPYVKHNEVLDLMLTPQLLLVILNQNANEEGRVTGKIFEYVATGNRVLGIGSVTSDCARVIHESESGEMIAFNNEEQLYTFIKSAFPCAINQPLNPRVMKYSRQSLTDALRANVFDECL